MPNLISHPECGTTDAYSHPGPSALDILRHRLAAPASGWTLDPSESDQQVHVFIKRGRTIVILQHVGMVAYHRCTRSDFQ